MAAQPFCGILASLDTCVGTGMAIMQHHSLCVQQCGNWQILSAASLDIACGYVVVTGINQKGSIPTSQDICVGTDTTISPMLHRWLWGY